MVHQAPDSGFPIRVALADDHAILRDSLKLLLTLDEGVELVAEYANGRDAVDGTLETLPDVLLMDLMMPHLNGIQATHLIKRDAPAVKVIIMSSKVDAEDIQNAIHEGASGYISKVAHADELLLAIRAVYRGNTYFSAEISEQFDIGAIVHAAHASRQRTGVERITSREREVLQLLVEGCTSKQIAAELVVSTKTVEGHKARMMEKLQVRSRIDLIRYALDSGIFIGEGLAASALQNSAVASPPRRLSSAGGGNHRPVRDSPDTGVATKEGQLRPPSARR